MTFAALICQHEAITRRLVREFNSDYERGPNGALRIAKMVGTGKRRSP